MRHEGLFSAITFSAKRKWNDFTRLSGLRKMIPMNENPPVHKKFLINLQVDKE